MRELYLTAENQGERIDRFLSTNLEDLSRSYIQKLVKEKGILVNGNPVKANYKVNAGDEICVQIPEPEPLDILPEDIPLDILYEDDDILVVNKPKGMVVHPAPGHYSHTLVNAVLYHCGSRLSGINGVLRPGIVHRIDMDTTGSLLICKNDRAHQILADELKEHNITRRIDIRIVRQFKRRYRYSECSDRPSSDRPKKNEHKSSKRQTCCHPL